MGLAASQARFLGVTMRKADCEYRSSQLAQERLELTNQMSDIAQDYSNAMNTTKLMWENGAVDRDYGVSYSLLMMPTAANDYNPYLITSTSGALILNSEYAFAARAAGISMSGGIGTESGRDKFISALINGGIITKESAKNITVTDYDITKATDGTITPTISSTQDPKNVAYNTLAGLGASPVNKSLVNLDTITDLIMDENIGGVELDFDKLCFHVESDGSITTEVTNSSTGVTTSVFERDFAETKTNLKNGFTMVNNGSIMTRSAVQEMTIGDLLSPGNEIILVKNSTDTEKFSEQMKSFFESIANVFGYNVPANADYRALNVDEAANEALDTAYKKVIQFYLREGNIKKSSNGGDSVHNNSAISQSSEYNRICQAGNYLAINLSHMVQAFLTYFAAALDEGVSDYYVGKLYDSETTNMVTDYRDYTYVVQNPNTEIKQENRLADFYDQVYNNICAHGWREDGAIDDNEYLESTIKDGRYTISALNNDGYFYQERYNDVGYMCEELDKDAIARAEVEYTQKKAELTYKEQIIDSKSKNLDAEIAELATEMESVKNIIAKAVEKTFTMFSN